jgi:hypothetical protein
VLDLYASFYERPADWHRLAGELGLTDRLGTRFGKLSGGQKDSIRQTASTARRADSVPGGPSLADKRWLGRFRQASSAADIKAGRSARATPAP